MKKRRNDDVISGEELSKILTTPKEELFARICTLCGETYGESTRKGRSWKGEDGHVHRYDDLGDARMPEEVVQ